MPITVEKPSNVIAAMAKAAAIVCRSVSDFFGSLAIKYIAATVPPASTSVKVAACEHSIFSPRDGKVLPCCVIEQHEQSTSMTSRRITGPVA